MSRTHHLTQKEADANRRPTRSRTKTRLTKLGYRAFFPIGDQPKNAGNQWRYGYSLNRSVHA